MSAQLAFATVETPIGPMLLAATDAGIAALSGDTSLGTFLAALRRRFPDADRVPDEGALREAIDWLRGYLAGTHRKAFAVDLGGIGRWDAAVYGAIRAIPYGETATYGEVAAMVGSPRAARAVGGALSRCPLFPAVPCHRVVLAADGISGWGGDDIRVKRRLLALERRRVPGLTDSGHSRVTRRDRARR